MYGKHVTKDLSAYAHGELAIEDSRRVSEHLEACRACRKEFEEIKLGIRLAESLPRRSAPPSLWDRIEESLVKGSRPEAERPSARGLQTKRPWFALLAGWEPLVAISCVLFLVLGTGAAWLYMRATRSSWEVARLDGSPTIGSSSFGETGRLAVGEWLETDASSRARVKVAEIGQVEIDPDTRIRLVETRLTEHRLELARGRMHATIWAPPRLFFVNTPSAVAADLGCAYTLEVDDRGRSLLRVTSGWVALELKSRESVVPAGAACVTEPGMGPGTPFFEDAPEEFVGALARFDFEKGGTEALDTVLARARARDTLTLWHLLSRVEGKDLGRVYARLAALAPPPEGVTQEGIMRLDKGMLTLWKEQLESTWLQESMPTVRKAWRSLWK